MRYYSIQIGDGTVFESHPGGVFDPGNLLVEMDIPVGDKKIAMDGAMVRVWGIGLDTIMQAKNLNNQTIKVYGGMMPGLPLATAQAPEAGLLVSGTIYPAFGNWIGTEMTLDLIISNIAGKAEKPANLVHQTAKGQPLADAIKTALGKAFPDKTANVNISPNLVTQYADTGIYQSIEQYGAYIQKLSLSIINAGKALLNGDYSGVQMAVIGDQINVSDGTQSSDPKTINFWDLLGQPTWIGLNQVQVKCVMRGDINVLDMVTLPPSLATTTAQSSPQLRTDSSFQGTFQVTGIRHVGNSRQPDGLSWNTTFDMIQQPSNGS